ncbi:hypothetical protein BRD15_04320 [Halobacteriales archaeon SW_6_65_15]|nr:MAG: hypothetical protein BRD15_04320 [Halobacteriales archaeon SW_6_65_15]
MRPRIASLDDRTGIEILDPIENHRYVLYTPETASPTPADTDPFVYPVSVASRIEVSALRLPYNDPVTVRDANDGSLVHEVGHDETRRLDADEYLVEISAPVKLYVRVASTLRIDAATDEVRLAFDGETPTEVGARSTHTSPADVITVPDDPEAVMAAVSTFGSALKTTTCERSWPTLRGHPPRLERGDGLAIPDDLGVPDNGVTIHVPADYEHVFTVAPLAYYFGAEVVPGDSPRLTAESGFEHRFDTDRGFEDEVVHTLKRTVLLDCVTRTEGFHPMDLHERRLLESATDLDFADLYDASLPEQLEAYLSVPDSALRDVGLTWDRVTHVRPTAGGIELLPYVANDLSLVRVQSPASESPTDRFESPERAALRSFKRGPGPDETEAFSNCGRSREREQVSGVPGSGEYVPLPDDDAMSQAWVGDGTPVHGAKLLATAFEDTRSEPTDGVIDVTVVCNDDRMREEWDAISDAYGARDVVSFDVECRFDATTGELRDLLADTHDLFHFIGHIDGRGFQCPDGVLDAETVAETGATTVLLNACRSHDQGVALVEAGARAAIVSWGDVDNLGAVEVGETFARLLNYGFDVGDALEIVEEYTSIGRHYVVLGDPGVTVAQCADGIPLRYELDRHPVAADSEGETVEDGDDHDELDVTAVGYATRRYPVGSVQQLYLRGPDAPDFHLVPGPTEPFTAEPAAFREAVGNYSVPLVADGELLWSDQLFDGVTE